MKKLKVFLCLILVFVSVAQCALVSNASTPYANYFISTNGTEKMTLPTPAAYEVIGTLNLAMTDIGSLNGAKDMHLVNYEGTDAEGKTVTYTKLYIVDTKNNRIVILTNEPSSKVVSSDLYISNNFRVDFIIEGDPNDPSDPATLKGPSGIYVDDDGTILVADTNNFRLVEFTERGNFRYAYEAPESELLGSDFNFQPLKVIKDERGYIYATSIADYHGVLLLNANGEFSSYFGANAVTLTFWESLVKTFFSREDTQGTIVTLPYTFQNIYISEDGYIYATTAGTSSGQLRKINSAGVDVLYSGYDFSDPGLRSNVALYDVAVDKDNNMFVLDNLNGRIYEYDKWGKNLFAFGSNGTGAGQFSSPQSIGVDDDGIVYVLDDQTNLITMFKPTVFADKVHEAGYLFSQGLYDDSFPVWQSVLEENSYYILALQSMGQIYHREEEYDKALDMYYKAEDATNYSTSFIEQRYDFTKEYFTHIVVVLLVLIVIWYVVSYLRRRYRRKHAHLEKKRTWFTPISEFFGSLKFVTRHPVDGFEGIRYENQSSYGAALAIMLIYFVTNMLSILCTSFIYRNGRPLSMTNWGLQIGLVFVPWIVVVIVNYGVTTIMYGEGRFRDIFIGGAYCHLPFIFTQLPMAILTNILTQEEASLFSLAQTIIGIWVGFMVFMCIKGVHGFHVGKAIIVLILTIAGVAAVSGLFMIFIGLASQMFEFIIQFGKELSYLV
ncbi:MAG: hypothetical protein E7388_05540 [Ruminococcaceae bacterium]|nr:hypothetical protein [Oscillospiraceae bacterium]